MFRASLMVLVTVGTFGSAASPQTAAAAKALRDNLAKPVTLEMGFQNTPLREALEFISDRYDVTILVDTQAFKSEGRMDSVDGVVIQLPKIVGIKLSTVLRLLLEQVDATYLIRSDHIEVTFRRARPDFGTAGGLTPTVNAEFDKSPLDLALQQLADLSGISIVVDGRVRDGAKMSVTATLNNVPVDTAVLILADMADLRPVALDNVLYVTTEENAKFLRNSSKRTESQESEWSARP